MAMAKIDESIIDRVLAKVATGSSLAKALAEEGINRRTWYEEMEACENLANRYARAKEDCADTYAERIAEAAEAEPERDQMTGRIDPGDVANRRLKVDALKWVAAKLKPKVYGDRYVAEHSGPGGSPIQIVTNVPIPAVESQPAATGESAGLLDFSYVSGPDDMQPHDVTEEKT